MIVRVTGANQNAPKSLSTDLVNTNRDYKIEDKTAIGSKIVETLYSNRVTTENKRIHTPSPPPPFKVGVFVVFYRQLELLYNIAWRGCGRKSFIFRSGSQ